MIGRFFGFAAQLLEAVGTAFDDRGKAFDDYEAGDFLAAGGRMESDGPDAAEACTCGSFDPLTDLHAPYCPLSGPGHRPHVRYWDKDFNEIPTPFSAAGVAAEPLSAPGTRSPVAADSPAPVFRAGDAGAGHTNSVSAVSSSPDTRGPGAGSTDRPLCEVFTDVAHHLDVLTTGGISAAHFTVASDYIRDVLIPECRDLAAQLEALDTQ